MPIEKVPLVHRFGIISHAQRLELQERLLKKSYLETFATQKPGANTRNPLEVTEEFIQHYNTTENLDEKEKLNDRAAKMLFRIKRRAGVKEGGSGDHVDLPLAWTELSQLAQCKGKIQEECLDVLITSLDQAPLHKLHIPALFFLAETTLYWLRTDAVHQPYLRTGEIKLLRMGQLVFSRLFFHHMAGQLQNKDDFKNRLFTYLDGFSDSQEAYSPYPNALFCVRYIIEVGKIIIGDCFMEAGEIKEGDNMAAENISTGGSQAEFVRESARTDDVQSTHSTSISNSVHDLSPTLWHALDVWRCVHATAGATSDATRALANCGQGLAEESWVDGVTALHILGDSAKCNTEVLKTLQNLARGVKPVEKRNVESGRNTARNMEGLDQEEEEGYHDDSRQPNNNKNGKKSSPSNKGVHSLSDIYENPNSGASSAPKSRNTDEIQSSAKKQQKDHTWTTLYSERHKTQESVTSRGGLTDYTTIPPNTGWKAEAGTEIHGNYGRASQASTVATYGNATHPDLSGLHGWRWEVAITYADVLADVCLHGNSSTIQKAALVGARKDISALHKTAIMPQSPMPSAGLLDLVYFHGAREKQDGGSNDWSWRIRYAAIQGLVKICRCCASDSTKEGMRNVAWNNLVKAHSLERDQRVLEALKVGQVESNIENLLSSSVDRTPQTIGSKIAGGLSLLYLPPLPPPIEAPPVRRRERRQTVPATAPAKTTEKNKLRTSLREEILLAMTLHEPIPSLRTRMYFDLNRVVEDQWRKELQAEVDAEEDERRAELERQQEADEIKQRQVEENRREKLKDKYRGKAYQYRDFSKTKLNSANDQKSGEAVAETVIKSRHSSAASLFGVRGSQIQTA